MPRIDPQQLLTCLQVLLTPKGGILSKDEVQRLANLMTKFSKKLVSKCIYVLILKNTDIELLGSFMAEGGWNLIHIWLQDAHLNKNWALVTELLELLLIAPVDVERLKMNNLPKLVKGLTKRDDLVDIQQRSSALVEEWLKIVKDVTKAEAVQQHEEVIEDIEPMEVVSESTPEIIESSANEIVQNNTLRFKLAIKDGKKVISKIIPNSNEENVPDNNIPNGIEEEDKEKKEKDEKKKSNQDKSHRSSSSSSRSRSKDGGRRDDKSRSKSSGSSSSSSKSSSRDKDRKDRDRSRSNGSSSKHRSTSSGSKSSSSSKDKDKDKKENKEKQAERDKDTLAKIAPPTLHKLGRIPKKSDEKPSTKDSKDLKKDEKIVKKPTFSVEVRKDNEEKPKTVKVFNSKMRSTGLLEEAKPPPSRAAITKKSPIVPTSLPTKRASPIRDAIPPPEKKSRLLDHDRPGAIKLIPPKPKPAFLQESDLFMDALTASAAAKKEPKKRKRRASTSKESSSPPGSPNGNIPSSPLSSPSGLKNITPANFYQDTLETADEEEKDEENADESTKSEIPDTPAEPDAEMEEVRETTRTDANGLKGVLSYAKRKGPKRSIRWRAEADLVEIQYFELDETERVNVMKPFMDMARMEMSGEREAMRARKLPNEDVMDTMISWRIMIELDLPAPQAEPGCKSLEKDIQFAREKRVLQAIYFNNKIPDTAIEPEHEIHQMTDPTVMPLEDPDNPTQDTTTQPWPEPKGSPPHVPNIPSIFPNLTAPPFLNMGGPPVGFPPGIPPFGPGFLPPMMGPPGGPGMMLNNGIPPNMPPPDMLKFDPPPLFAPPDFVPNNINENGFPPQFNQPNNMGGMFPPNNFNNMRGRGGFRRGGNNNGPWVRMSGNNMNQGGGGGWNGRGGGGPNRGSGGPGRFCINFKKHGYCRNRDKCPYMHPK